jgi:hypothetical protein
MLETIEEPCSLSEHSGPVHRNCGGDPVLTGLQGSSMVLGTNARRGQPEKADPFYAFIPRLLKQSNIDRLAPRARSAAVRQNARPSGRGSFTQVLNSSLAYAVVPDYVSEAR